MIDFSRIVIFVKAPKSRVFDVYKVGPETIVTNGGMQPL